MNASARRHLAWAAFAYVSFVIYGSLVPLDFQAKPLEVAWAEFGGMPFLNLGIASRADWVANILLFIPLAFASAGMLCLGRGLAVRLAASALVLASCLVLSLSIEFVQIFFPPRTVSRNDVMAETLGAAAGIAVWWLWGQHLMDWYLGWRRVSGNAALGERLAWTYLAALSAYSLLPLDLTISAVELYHKWQEGKVYLLPFASLPGNAVEAVYALGMDMLLWLPPALLFRLSGKRSSLRAGALTLAAAALLEGMQLFVYSRVSDVSDLFTATLGAAAGAWLGARLAARGGLRPLAPSAVSRSSPWLPWALATAWCALLAAVFWYPYDFRIDSRDVAERLESFGRAPFSAYYYGNEFRAVTEVLHKLLFFAPLGALLGWWVVRLPWTWRLGAAALAFLLLAGVPLTIELGQVLLPEKFSDSADLLLETLGGVLGYGLFRFLRARLLIMPAARCGAPVRRRRGRGGAIASATPSASPTPRV